MRYLADFLKLELEKIQLQNIQTLTSKPWQKFSSIIWTKLQQLVGLARLCKRRHGRLLDFGDLHTPVSHHSSISKSSDLLTDSGTDKAKQCIFIWPKSIHGNDQTWVGFKCTTSFCRTATVGSYLQSSKEPASPPTLEIFSTRQTCLTSTRRKMVSRSGCFLQSQFQRQPHKTEAMKYGASHCFLMQ